MNRRTAMLMVGVLGACGGSSAMDPDTTTGSTNADTTSAETTSTSTGVTSADVSSTDAPTTSGVDSSTGDSIGGCDGTSLLPNPADFSARGPWPVGVRTTAIDDLTVEVWYPAVPGSEAGVDAAIYDIRLAIPESEREKISDADNPWQNCDCHRDLPIDDTHGPYPVIVFVHGTASFRTQSLPQMVHWASRGFVVIAADHPGLWLADLLGGFCGGPMVMQELGGDVDAMLAAVRGDAPGLEDFTSVIDAERIGMAGHSAGGGAVAAFGDDAQVIVPLASGGVTAGGALQSVLVMGGTDDSIVAYTQQQSGYADAPSPKRLVGIAAGGHLSFSEICSLKNDTGDDLLEIATTAGVCGAQFAGFLFQCSETLIADPEAWAIVDFATAAAFEETLHCGDIGDAFDVLRERAGVQEVLESQ
jgi:predicted dienelactone hydrolase